MRRRDCKDPGYAHRCCTLAFTFIPSSHSHSSFFPLHIAPSSYLTTIPTILLLVFQTLSHIRPRIRLHIHVYRVAARCVYIFFPSFALHFVVSFAFFFCTVFSLVLVACGDGIGGSTSAVSATCRYPSSVTPRPL
ncbi:hypothetical protein B0H14DRAFT_3026425, partial [Mycena olivaceomarginata]